MSEIPITDIQTDEEVGVIREDGSIDTDDDLLEEELPIEDGTVEYMTAGEVDGHQAYFSQELEPGDKGYRRAVVEAIPAGFKPDVPKDEDLARPEAP